MRHFFLFTLLVSLFAVNVSAKTNADIFSYDKQAVSKEFAQLNNLENFVASNEGITLSDMQKAGNPLVANVISSPLGFLAMGGNEPPAGIPSFLWGCVLSWVGMLIVYLTMDEGAARSAEVKKALWGCITGALVGAVVYVVFFIVLATTAVSTATTISGY